MPEDYQETIASLEALYQPCVEAKDTMKFLRAFGVYMEYLDSHKIFKILIDSAKHKHAKEEAELVTERIMGKEDPALIDMMSEELGNKYPTYQYARLKKHHLYWKALSHLKTKKQVEVAQIIHTEKYESGESHGVGIGALLTLQTEQFKKDLALLHIKFITDLMWLSEHDVTSSDLSYDPKKGILYFDGKEIMINERQIHTNAHHLLVHLFSDDAFEEHHYAEMEESKVLLDPKTPKSYYDACESIQKKVLEATKITDFLLYGSGKKLIVHINPKYKPNS